MNISVLNICLQSQKKDSAGGTSPYVFAAQNLSQPEPRTDSFENSIWQPFTDSCRTTQVTICVTHIKPTFRNLFICEFIYHAVEQIL